MSLIRPSGREPASVYWMRRGAVVVIVITVVAIIYWFFTGRGSGEPVAEVSPGTETVVDGASTAPTVVPTEPQDCADSDIVVRAKAAKKVYVVGETPELILVIKNRGTAPCVRDVGPRANEIEIRSGGYHVWSSDDCNASKRTKPVTMQPGETYAATLQWNGRLSQKGCPDPKGPRAKAGSYQVLGRNGEVFGEERGFSLRPKESRAKNPQEAPAEE